MAGRKQRARSAAVHSVQPMPVQPAGGLFATAETTGAMVIRFHRRGAKQGVASLASAGLKVASASDFRAAADVPPDFGGADVQYFERFGIAIVRPDHGRVQSAMTSIRASGAVANARPERIFRPLGMPTTTRDSVGVAPLDRLSRDYLTGLRDGVTQTIDHILGGGGAQPAAFARATDEADATWGLQATRVTSSKYSGNGIKVAVLDTGFDLSHPDFAGRDVTTKSFMDGEDVNDVVGHGTHCIGTACGPLRPAGQPRYGIAYGARIYAGKVLSNAGFGTDRSIIAGIDWALEQGCQVISMSLGAPVQQGESYFEDYEVIGDTALDENALVVAAAGNESFRPGFVAPVGSPANSPSIMAVSAVDVSMGVASFSCGAVNPGQDIDLAGPGVNVLSSVPGGYGRKNGTSMATPHVAGIAALFAESDAKYRGRALWTVLTQRIRVLNLSARDVGKGLVQAPS